MKIVLLFLLPFTLHGQIFNYDYDGLPGDIKVHEINCQPNDMFMFDFFTQSAPDKLTVYTNTDSLHFYIGAAITTALPSQGIYKGYCEFEYYDNTFHNIIIQGIYPPDFTYYQSNVRGTLRLYYTTQDTNCNLKFKIEGNKVDYTVYYLTVYKLENGFVEVIDTIQRSTCEKNKKAEFLYENCTKHLIQYQYNGIDVQPIINYPTCYNTSDGEIIVPSPYQGQSLKNIPIGQYNIELSNQYCTQQIQIEINKTTGLCGYYIPNIFTDQFQMFTQYEINYNMEIYDRWGELVFTGQNLTSNDIGWIPNKNIPSAVYTYKIVTQDGKQLTGTITYLK